MDFSIKTGQPEKQRTNCLVLGIYESGKMLSSTTNVDKISGGLISKAIKLGDIKGKTGQTFLLVNVPNITADRILLVGFGKSNKVSAKNFNDSLQKMSTTLASLNIKDAITNIVDVDVADRDVSWKVQRTIIHLANATYKFDAYKSKPERVNKGANVLKSFAWLINNKRLASQVERGIKAGEAIQAGLKLTKDLANTPPNVCNPSYVAKAAQSLAKTHKKVSVAVLDTKEISALKMGAIIAVGQGSANKPKLVTLEYRGAAKNTAPIVFIGKGITFDSGGNSLKPAASMVGMKYDMCGAATVLGIIEFCATLGLGLNVVGVIAAAENMPGGEASRPDDIITTMSGTTVEILNTDAEGRLVLADALTYSERFKPSLVIDMATLTGACVVALGSHHAGLFSNYQPLADDLLAAGVKSGDKCWQMPITDEYHKQLDSNAADITNIGGPEAGSITAACFLAKFAKDFHWAHLDIAGTACKFTGKDRGATGSPIPMLTEFLLNKAK